jgi:hypothetical protein
MNSALKEVSKVEVGRLFAAPGREDAFAAQPSVSLMALS